MLVGDDTREERLKTVKRHPCDICKKKFYRSGNLKRHVALHELGFDCRYCDDPKPHPSSAALAEHISRRHSSAIVDPEWKIVKTHQTNSKRWQKNSTCYEVELRHSGHVAPTFENFDTIFSSLLDRVVPQSEAADYMTITLESDVLDTPIISNYTRVSDLNVSTLFNVFSAQLNSQLASGMDNFRLDSNMKVWVDRVGIPSGPGGSAYRGSAPRKHAGEYSDFDAALKSKRSIIRIREDNDHLCFPSAVAMAIEWYKCYKTCDEPHVFNLIRQAYAKKKLSSVSVETLKELARDILKVAGLTERPCGVVEIAAIQKSLPDYQINVYAGRGGGALIYQGPEASRKLYLILDEVKKQYHVATSMKGWHASPYGAR